MKTDHYLGYIEIRLEDRDWLVNRGRSARGFIEDLKRGIPWDQREYDPERKAWTVPEEYGDLVREYYKKRFSDPNQEEMGF